MIFKAFRHYIIQIAFLFLLFTTTFISKVEAQYLLNSDSAFKAGTPNSGRLWGYVFGDFFYKGHSDSLNRGGNNQYTNIKQGQQEFQFRRIYLGYDYNITKNFSAEILFAAEDDFTSGDLLQNNKFTTYIKLANIRWKNFLFKGNDLLVGMQPSPAYSYVTENLFSFSRPVERTITDIRRTPSFDFGAGMQGRFLTNDQKTIIGYNILLGNGSSDKIQNLTAPLYKWFSGDVFVGLLKNRLIIDLYADYQRQNWAPSIHGHASRQLTKLSLIWVDKSFTFGTEGFINNLKQMEVGLNTNVADTLDGKANGLSLYAHANLIGKKLKAFVRYDWYNPNTKFLSSYSKYASLYNANVTYEPNNKERFMSIGLDYSPVNNVHFIPNIWYNKYISQQSFKTGATANDFDLVYRLTFFFTFGKLLQNPTYSYYPYH